MSEFEIVPRNEGTPDPKEDQPSTLSILETIAGWFGQAIAAIIGGVGQVIAGVAIGAVEFAGAIIDAAKQLAGGIAKAIKGEGASMKVISGAVDERLGPIDTAISQSGEKMLEIGEKVDESIREQDRIHEQMVENSEQLKEAIAESERVQKERVAVENTLRNEINASLRAAESAQESADGKSTNYYGSNTPKSPKAGDTWFKQVKGGSQILQFADGKWVQRSDFAKYEKDLADNKLAVKQAALDVADTQKKVKNLVEVELPKISAGTAQFNQALASEKAAREKALKTLGTKLDEAKGDLEELGYSRPGNIFPDPFLKHPAWHTVAQPKEGGLVIPARSPFNEPWWKGDRNIQEIPVEPGASYLVTMDVKQPNKGRVLEFMTLSHDAAKRNRIYSRATMQPVGVGVGGAEVMAGVLKFPETIDGRCSVAIKAFFNSGDKDLWVDNVRMVRAADNSLVVDGAITAAKVHAGAIDTKHLAADAVKAGKIASDAVTARELKSDSVYAKHIVSGQITGKKIAANTITGNNILANSITANELQIRPGNLFPDPHFQDPCWGTSGNAYAHSKNGGELRLFPNGKQIGKYYQPKGFKDQAFVLEEGAKYRITATVWTNAKDLAKAKIDIYTRYVKADGKISWIMVGSLPVDGKNTSTPSCVITMPSDMKDGTCTLGFYINPPWNGGQISMWNVQMVRAADASLIVDGAILAKHIKAGEITSKQIAADTITGDNLKADQITGREIKSGTINADQLVVNKGFIKTAMIGDGQITNAKIGNLDAGKITTGELDGKRIKADSITVKELRANSIVPIGGSLIHHEPPPSDTTKPPEPIWWRVFDNELSENYRGWSRPEGNPWRTASGAMGKEFISTIGSRLVKVQPGQKYRLQFWCRATVPDTSMIIKMWDQKGRNAVKSGAVSGDVKTGNFQTAKEAKQPWPVTDFSKSTAGIELVDKFILPTEATKVVSTIEFKDGVEYVCLREFRFNHWSGSNKGNQWIAGLSLELDIPDQAQVDRLQDENIKRLAETSDLNSRFVDEQKKTNRMVQQQQWIHQDMIELLDVRTPKIYGWPAGYSNGGYVTCPYNNRKGHLIQMPYHEQWECGDGSGSEVVVAARGQWSGWMHVSINWDSGVVDDWAVPVENDQNNRIYLFEGGAHHIKKRSISVEIYPRSLNRTASVRIYDASGKPNLSGDKTLKPRKWANSEDKNRLFRSAPAGYVRPKNTVTCDKDIWVRNEQDLPYPIKAGEHIYAAVIYPEDQRYADGTKFTFTEIDDPVRMDSRDNFGYGTDKKRAVGKVTRRYSKV